MSVRILSGDCREVLRSLPAESVHCVVTSPPYFGLRDYGTAKWEGGDPGCDHNSRRLSDFEGVATDARSRDRIIGKDCKCGARRIDSQIGLEPTIGEYVETMVKVFREVRRVLRRDGTLWLNLGDSYATRLSGDGWGDFEWKTGGRVAPADGTVSTIKRTRQEIGLKPKDLCGVPWRVAFALQADGWYLRSDIIWSKPNPMPESVTDRPTKAHEYLFLLSKSASYYYDGDAIREPYNEDSLSRYNSPLMGVAPGARQPNGDIGRREREKGIRDPNPLGRNRRSVWTITTESLKEAHFATFPPALVEPCIRAGTSDRGCCAKCGAPWVRKTETTYSAANHGGTSLGTISTAGAKQDERESAELISPGFRSKLNANKKTLGWSPSCSCFGHFEDIDGPEDWISRETGERKKVRVYVPDRESPPPVPGIVLDPFGGAGTTGLVADRLGRNAVLIELNREYIAMAEKRLRGDAPLFAEVAAE